jgi:hypothetical protein
MQLSRFNSEKKGVRVTLALFILLLSFSPLKTNAENSYFVSAWNQVKSNNFCGNVQMDSLKGSGVCDRGTSPEDYKRSASRLFEDFAFKNAAPIEVAKNKCQMEKLKVITGNGRLRDTWTKTLLQVWLMQKKAKLVLAECKNKFFNKIDPIQAKQLSPKKAYLEKVKKEIEIYPERAKDIRSANDKYLNICFDPKAIAAMKNVEAIAESSVPGISSARLFKMVDNNQNLIKNSKTGKPLTDSDLLNNDLSDLSFLDFNNCSPLFDKIDKYNKDIYNEKAEINKKLTSKKPLDDDLKEMLFKSGSVTDALERNNLLVDSTGRPNPGAVCLVNRYEPNILADTAEFAGTTLIGGLLIKAVLTVPNLFKVARAAESMYSHYGYQEAINGSVKVYELGETVARKSVFAASVVTSTARLVNKCFKTGVTMKKLKEKGHSETSLLVQGRKDLSKVTDFEKWQLDYKPEEIPTCVSEEIGDNIARENEQRSCLINEASYGLPFSVALPATIVNAGLDAE